MTRQEKLAYFQAIKERYRRAGRVQKARILDEFCAICGYNRKYAIRRLGSGVVGRPRKRGGRQALYHEPEFHRALKRLWFVTDQRCGKLLKAAIPEFLPFYSTAHEPLEKAIENKLLQVSASTIDRLLKPHKARYGKGYSLTKPGSIARNEIPIQTSCWDIAIPGFVEADTVAHCGTSMQGPFAWTLTLTDICTTWTENRAVWTRNGWNTVEKIKDIEAVLPFPILGFDCDNGAEFLNDHLIRYFQGKRIPMTRSRPYRKNDNAHVEQKNWSSTRQLLGYERFDDISIVPLMNDLYRNEWAQFFNHFLPSFKLREKMKVQSRYVRRYETPTTPYQRVLASPHVDDEQKQRLKSIHDSLDPFQLKRNIERKLKIIFQHARSTSAARLGIPAAT